MQVRLDPLEEQLPSQSATIQSGCGYGRERKFVGQGRRLFLGTEMNITEAPIF
jgi:hypothetical protein